jgi:hypothetical protein
MQLSPISAEWPTRSAALLVDTSAAAAPASVALTGNRILR